MIPIQIPTVDFWALAPVSAVIVTGILALMVDLLWPRKSNSTVVAISLIGLAAAAALTIPQFGMADGESFGAMILRDRLGLVMQLLLIGTCALCFLFSDSYLREKRIAFSEFYPLALWSTAGGMIMVTTENLLMLFLGLEVLSISLYCLAGMSRQEQKSEESAMKYFLLGSFASAFLLFGVAFLFGASGTLRIDDIASAWTNDSAKPLIVFGVALILVGLGFKAAFVPFHQWTPDVYQGAPTNVTAFMAAASKVAAFGALVRVLVSATPVEQFWFPALFWVAILTMSVGNLIALWQKDVKRALGYSSIAHAGYVLVALLAHLRAPDQVPLTTTIFYLVSYSLMTVGSFAVVSLAASKGIEGTRFQDLYGLWQRAPFAAASMVVFVASLIGVPPTSGFVGKLLIFQDALTAGLPVLALVLAVNSAVSAYYYLGIIRAAFISDEGALKNRSAAPTFGLTLTCVLCAAGVLLVAFLAAPLGQALEAPSTTTIAGR